MSHLFISHSTRDGGVIARELAAALEAAGHRCWIAPRDVKPGVPYPGQIVSAIEACDGLIVIVTPEANESSDVLQELQLAASERKVIAPVIVDTTAPSPNLRYYIGVRHQIPWTDVAVVSAALQVSFPPPAAPLDQMFGNPEVPVELGAHDARNGQSTGVAIGIASGKGGVGKTWLAINLAASFARTGKRTLLVDASRGLAGVDVQLGLKPEGDIVSAISGEIEFSQATTLVTVGDTPDEGFDIAPLWLTHPGEFAGTKEITHGAFVLRVLKSRYDVVLVDLNPGMTDDVMRLARSCDACLVVVIDQPTSMTDAYAFMKIMRGYAPAVKLTVAVNMADADASGRKTYGALATACKEFLGVEPPLAGVVLSDARIREAIRRREVLMAVEPLRDVSVSVAGIAEYLLSSNRGASPPPTPAPVAGRP